MALTTASQADDKQANLSRNMSVQNGLDGVVGCLGYCAVTMLYRLRTKRVKVKLDFALVNVFTIHAVIVECHEMQEQMNLWRSKQMSSYC